MTARKPLDLNRIAALDARATPGPWRVVLDDTEGPTTVWQTCTSPVHTEEVDPNGDTVLDCCTDGGLHGEPFFLEADAAFVAEARTALPRLVAEVRELRAQLDAIRALHTDSPAGVCPTCYRLSEASQSEVDDGLVDYPCPTLRAMGIEDAGPSRPGPLAGYTVRPLPPVLCGATDLMLFGFGCTKPAGHTGDRHTAEVPGVGSYTWGYVPTPEEAAAGQDTPEGCPNCPPGYDCESGHYDDGELNFSLCKPHKTSISRLTRAEDLTTVVDAGGGSGA